MDCLGSNDNEKSFRLVEKEKKHNNIKGIIPSVVLLYRDLIIVRMIHNYIIYIMYTIHS